jgi:signal transduction histidine kinase
MKASVLIVDDIRANLVAMQAQLEKLGCDLVLASSGNEALAWLLKREFAVMLLDVQMPEMDGFEVARLARENPATRDVPIIFVTAMHETEKNALVGYDAGAVDFLFKPINHRILRSKVQVFVDLFIGRQKLASEIEAHKATLAELEAFNYSVSHDLRAPLRPLQGFAEALLEEYGGKLDDQAKTYLQRIGASALRMSELIDDLLELSRMARAEVDFRAIDLAAIAQAIVAELRAGDPDRVVTFVCPPEAPAQGDARLLRIVLENLFRNAWKFTKKVTAATIEFGLRTDDGTPVFFVRDNGAGFDPIYAEKLFQPFQRLHSAAEFEGTGIGLAIVQRIIRRHRGRVWGESAVGQGATLLFSLGHGNQISEIR